MSTRNSFRTVSLIFLSLMPSNDNIIILLVILVIPIMNFSTKKLINLFFFLCFCFRSLAIVCIYSALFNNICVDIPAGYRSIGQTPDYSFLGFFFFYKNIVSHKILYEHTHFLIFIVSNIFCSYCVYICTMVRISTVTSFVSVVALIQYGAFT